MRQHLFTGAPRRAAAVVRRRAEMFARTVRQTYVEHGATAAVREGLALFGELAARPVRMRRERSLDRRFNLDTAADPGAPGTTYGIGGPAFDDAVAYSPVPMHHFQRLIGRLPISGPAGYTFVDLGCGKGRTLILAAEHGFGRVVGVELDPRLARVARRNASGRHTVTVVEGDVVAFEFPPEPTVVFLFNPFGAETLRAVVQNLEYSLERTPRRLFVAYFNAVHHDVLDDSPALRRRERTRLWAVYEG